MYCAQKNVLMAACLIFACLTSYLPAMAQLTFTEYAGPTTPMFENNLVLGDITSGADGNLWFTENYAFGAQTQIGRITPSGVTSYFSIPSGSSETGITQGPDGNVWFSEYRTNRIGKITPNGVFSEFVIPGGANPYGITSGPDGNIWFTEAAGNEIVKVTQNATPEPSALIFLSAGGVVIWAFKRRKR